MPKTAVASAGNALSPTLIAWKPRQVLLSKANMKQSDNYNDNGNKDKEARSVKPQQKALILHSIAKYLERNGFSKTLKKFRSEAEIGKEDLGSFLDFEEIFCKYLEMGDHSVRDFDEHNGQDKKSKRKKSKIDESDRQAVDSQSGAAEEFDGSKKSEKITGAKSEEKRKGTKFDDSLDQIEQVSVEALKKPTDGVVCNEHGEECKDKKKKKSKLGSETLADNVEQNHLKSLPVTAEGKYKDVVSHERRVTNCGAKDKTRDKKKKKNKFISDSPAENVEQGGLKDKEEPAVTKVQGVNTVNANDILLEGKSCKSKSKKKTKDGSVSESLHESDNKELHKLKLRGTVSKMNDNNISEDDVADKVSKKRKRFDSEENDCQPAVESKDHEELKRRKRGCSEETKGSGIAEVNASMGTEKHGSVNELQTTPAKQPDGQANENLGQNGARSSMQISAKKQTTYSKEAKKPFQRVNINEVVFVDERLQDNSYWAKDGAENGYGAKAQEILGQVRGRDFRHEKTKKKRGSYKGGLIDLQSHSVKFNYSDDE